MDFEFSPNEMAERLLYLIKDCSDTEEEMEEEIASMSNAFAKLQKSDDLELNALAHHLDILFMQEALKSFDDKEMDR